MGRELCVNITKTAVNIGKNAGGLLFNYRAFAHTHGYLIISLNYYTDKHVCTTQ